MKTFPSKGLNNPFYCKEEKNHNKLNEVEYWYKKGQQLMLSEKYSAAINAYDLAIDKNTEFAEAYFSRGACYYVLGYYRRATDDINAAALLGCQIAQFWSKFESNPLQEYDDEEVFWEHLFAFGKGR
jgi:tetratricopeptide (TPR) repeat protein